MMAKIIVTFEITRHAIWPLEKYLTKRDRPKAQTANHGLPGLILLLLEKGNALADCMKNQFKPLDLCEETYERRVKVRVRAVSEAVNNNLPDKERPCHVQNLIKALKLRKTCAIDGIPNECLRHLPRKPLINLSHLFNHCFRLSQFPLPRKETKAITLPKSGKNPKLPQNLRQISFLSTMGKHFDKVSLKVDQMHIQENITLNACQFVFYATHKAIFRACIIWTT
jgi:hypothetical protein